MYKQKGNDPFCSELSSEIKFTGEGSLGCCCKSITAPEISKGENNSLLWAYCVPRALLQVPYRACVPHKTVVSTSTRPSSTLSDLCIISHHPESLAWSRHSMNMLSQWMSSLKSKKPGTSLVVQWLILLHLPVQGIWIQSLVGELRRYMPHSQKMKT